VLRRDEWTWLPLAPVLLWQGWRATRSVPRLPVARGGEGRVHGAEPALRLLGLGDSTIAGVGCNEQADAITGAVAARVAAVTGRAVEWCARGASGATAEAVRRALLPSAPAYRPDLVVLSVGVNDAVRGREPAAFVADVLATVEAFRAHCPAAVVVYAGMPPLGTFPALAPPLATLLGTRARRLEAALAGALDPVVPRVQFPEVLASEAFAADGFHPGVRGCAAWAEWIVERLRAAGAFEAAPRP
jgi:lysophospholipase L1-like esterase